MKHSSYIVTIAVFVMLLQSCTTTRRFGTTIERDENNPCQINMVIQVAIQGTDADYTRVKSELEDCYNKKCFIPCPNDSTRGCLTQITVVVKKYGDLKEDERNAFHYVEMVDDDGQPSWAYIGTPNSGAVSGMWRRNQPYGVYCHEVLHFCGLRDKYCARIFDPVTGNITTERICDPPPEPSAGACCIPTIDHTRCSTPCDGHHDDLMGTSSAPLSCDNIFDVLKGANLNSCPPECCASDKTFTRPIDETYFMPGYKSFGDKNYKFGSLGVSIGGTKYISSTLGVTIDAGHYTDTDKENNYKQTNGLSHITAGVTYQLGNLEKSGKGPSLTAHALGGIARWTQKITTGSSDYKSSKVSLQFNLGGALNLKLNRSWTWRVLQADYAPTFFYESMQHNFRLGTGIVYQFSGTR